jgi:hypothetical protein
MLSTEADGSPVEPRVVPIVYALFASGLARPRWSSEGRSDTHGRVTKWPGVWFASTSFTYLDLLDTALTDLHESGRTRREGRVELCSTQPDPAHALYGLAVLRDGVDPKLEELHDDLRSLGEHLDNDVRRLARQHL